MVKLNSMVRNSFNCSQKCIWTAIYIFMMVYVCVCVCVC